MAKTDTNFVDDTLLPLVVETLDTNKAADIVTIPIAEKTSIADYLVIASGGSSRQLNALSDYLSKALKTVKILPTIEGKNSDDWVLLDAGDIIVHLFKPDARDFYQLESMWMSPEEYQTYLAAQKAKQA